MHLYLCLCVCVASNSLATAFVCTSEAVVGPSTVEWSHLTTLSQTLGIQEYEHTKDKVLALASVNMRVCAERCLMLGVVEMQL